jgi:DNA-binding transcriptional LysR family regulator
MDRLDTMRLYTRIVDLGSFTAAAEESGIPRATATYAVQQMEKRLGVRLLVRSTRHVATTPEGQVWNLRCRQVLADIDEAQSQLGVASTRAQGRLRVDLQPSLASEFVFPRLAEFCARHPGIELVVGTGDRLVDMVREGVDCVLRGGEPREPGLVGRRVAALPMVTVASREYLDRHGVPRTLEQFARHRAVNYVSSATGRPMPFQFVVGGKPRSMTLEGAVSVTSAEAYNACALHGLGFIQTARLRLEEPLRDGSLVEVFPQWAPPPGPVWVMYPRQRHLALRVRVFVDWLVEQLAPYAPDRLAQARAAPRGRGRTVL